jgi:hypothetical protein
MLNGVSAENLSGALVFSGGETFRSLLSAASSGYKLICGKL